MQPSKVLAAVSSAASCGNGLPHGAEQSGHLCGVFECPAEASSLVKKWNKGLTLKSKHLVCKGEQLTSISGPALVT